MPVDATALRRLRWRCRRGMLENDLVLVRFLDRWAATLENGDLAVLDRLLALPDPELWELLSGRQPCEDAGLAPMVERLRTA